MDALIETLPEVKTLSDDDLFDEMRAQVTWARNEMPGYDRARFNAVMTEMHVRKLLKRP